MHSKNIAAAALAAALVASSASAAAPRYRLTKLASPPASVSAVARAISANGQIAGESRLSPTATGNTPVNYGGVGALTMAVTATPAGTTNGFVRGINDSGIAAGTAHDSIAATSQAILTTTSGVSVLNPVTGLANAGATGINNAGTVVGYSQSIGIFAGEGTARPIRGSEGTQRATVWTNGVAAALTNPLGNFNSIATAVNASGQVAGAAINGNSIPSIRAVRWTNGVATVLTTDIGFSSTARAISSAGWVAGRVNNLSDGVFTGRVWAADGSHYALDALAGCSLSDLRGINASGTAVGFSQDGACTGTLGTAGQLWQRNGTGYTGYAIDSLVVNLDGWRLTAPQAINDAGQIVGFGTDGFGVQRGFLLTAVPEPASWAMLIIGFGLTGSAMRRHRGNRRVQPA